MRSEIKRNSKITFSSRARQVVFPDCEEAFNVLVIADFKKKASRKEVNALKDVIPKCKAIIYLGDINEKKMASLKKNVDMTIRPQFGVLGDNDDTGLYERLKIDNLHGKFTRINNIRFAGFEGTCKFGFKEKPLMRSDWENEKIAEVVPPCDILISHDIPRIEENYQNRLGRDSGNNGIGEYLTNHTKVKYNLHCHTGEYKEHYYTPNCRSIRLERFALVTVSKYGIKEEALC